MALSKDHVIEIAEEMRRYRIKDLPEDEKKSLCERAQKTFNGRMPENLRYLEDGDLFTSIMNSRRFASIARIPFSDTAQNIFNKQICQFL